MISKLLETIENLGTKTTKTAIPLLQTTAAIMIPKSQVQSIQIWHYHSGAYYQQLLIQQ